MNSFAIDEIALLLAFPFCLLCYVLYRYKQTFPIPQIYVGSLTPLITPTISWRERFYALPRQLKLAALAALLLAFIDPRIYIEQQQGENFSLPPSGKLATEGIALYLALDQSSSMAEKISAHLPGGQVSQISKIELLKKATESFIKGDAALGLPGRPNDLIGLVEFARTTHVVVPLTLDRKTLLAAVADFDIVHDPSQDGTAIGYAILKTVQLIAATRSYARDLIGQGMPAYEIKNSAIILVTDGLQDPNPADVGSRWRRIDPIEAAHYIKEQGIRVYIVNIDPRFNAEQYAPNRRQLQKAAEITGGKLFMLGGKTTLTDIYAAIDAIEKSTLPLEDTLIESLKQKLSKEKLRGLYHTFFMAPYLIALAISCLFAGIIFESTLLRRVP